MLNKIKKDIFDNPVLTGKQIKVKDPRLLSQVSLRTIRRVLLEYLNLKTRVAAKKISFDCMNEKTETELC